MSIMSMKNKYLLLIFASLILIIKSITSQQCSANDKSTDNGISNNTNFTTLNNFYYKYLTRDFKIYGLFDNDGDDKNDDLSTIISELIEQVTLFLSHNSNLTIIYKDYYRNENCSNAISNSTKDSVLTFEMIKNSGKSLSDIGLQKECEMSKLKYIFIELEIDLNIYMNNNEFLYLYKFLGQKKFFWGLCLWKECDQFYRDFTDISQNQIFFDYLASFGIKNLTTYNIGYKTHVEEFESQSDFYAFLFVIYLISAYILIRLVLTIVAIFITKDSMEYSPNSSNEIRDESSYDEDTQNKTAANIYLNSRVYNAQNLDNHANSSKKNNCLKTFFKFLNFSTHIKYLLKPANKIYEESGLEYITFFRVCLFFWATYNHNLYAITKIPHRDFTNLTFYTSIWFCIVKYSTFAIEGWVVLDGMIMSYKLMSYIKRNSKDFYVEASFKTFMKFYFNFLTKILVFFAIFFLLHVWMEYYTYFFDRSPMYEFFVKDILGGRTCKENPITIFIPFYLQYYDVPNFDPNLGFVNCYRFANVYLNEFYSFTIFMFIFYFAYKFKSKVYDYSILFIFIINTLLSFLSYGYDFTNNPQNDKLTYNIFLGDAIGFKYTHLFINTYALGVFAGLIYFHYNNVLSRNPLEMGDDYIPFKYTFDIMKLLDTSKKWVLKFYFFLSIFMQILISTSFYFFILFFSDYSNSADPLEQEDKKLNIKINWLIYLTYIYERKIFSFFFVLMLLSFLMYPKPSLIKHLVHSNMLVPMNRISFSYLGAADTIVYCFYSLYSVQTYINNQNMFFITIGLIHIISFMSMVITILFEVPLRIIYKNLIRR